MDFYTSAQRQQLAPLIALDLGEIEPHLRKHLEEGNVGHKFWDNVIIKNRLLSAKYILRYVTNEEDVAKDIGLHKAKQEGVHSHLSPFNASSDLFPNGILSDKWFVKYVEQLPFALVSVHTLPGDKSQDEVLGATLATLRQKYSDFGVRFVAIVTSGSTNADVDEDRIAALRQFSGLPRLSGLFYLNTEPQTLDRDCGVLVSTMFSTLKPAATDFYSLIEHRVKQRYKKYYSVPPSPKETVVALTPKILEVRCLIKQAMLSQFMHPHNVEPSLSTIEQSYEMLISLMRELGPTFFLSTLTSHDEALYAQWRTLLDIIAIHLIRGYFSVEEPVAALRKHEAHIANVLDLIQSRPEDEKQVWVSIQYQWLGDLMSEIPPSVVKDLYLVTKGKNKSNLKSTSYFGGLTFHDNFYSHVVTEVPLIYVRAAGKLSRSEFVFSSQCFPHIFADTRAVKLHRIKLLETAKARAAKQESTGARATGLIDLIEWEIAEEFMNLEQYEAAIEHYSSILSNSENVRWTAINGMVSQRIVLALQKMGDSERVLQQIAEISITSRSLKGHLKPPELNGAISVRLNGNQNFLEIKASIFNESSSSDTHAYDTIVSQLNIRPNFATSVFDLLYPGCEVKVTLDRLIVEHTATNLTLSNTGNGGTEVQTVPISNQESTFDDVDVRNTFILRLKELVTEPGFYEIKSITAHVKIVIATETGSVEFTRVEAHEYNSAVLKYSMKVLSEDANGVLQLKTKRLEGASATKLFVKPYRPDVAVKLTFPFVSAIVGEKFDLSFNLAFAKPQVDRFTFQAVHLEAKTRVLEDGVETEDLHVQANWQFMKDDEPLDILEFISSTETSCARNLQVSIRRSPSTGNLQKRDLRIVFVINMIVIEESGEVSSYDLESYELPVMSEPFASNFLVLPRAKENGSLPMPNPFIIGSETGDLSKEYSMPLPSRAWLARVVLSDPLKLLESGLVEITQAEIFVKSKNPEIVVEWESSPLQKPGLFEQLFLTSSKHRFTHRNVKVMANASLGWKRKDQEIQNTYETEEWEITLPLQDPRVLLLAEKRAGREVVLKYTVENPTPRILTFTTTMVTEHTPLSGTVWNFDSHENIVPQKQKAFPVLPFSQYKMTFVGTYEVDEDTAEVELPQLEVYDVNYKVSLPTLPLEDSIRAAETALIMKT